MSEGKKQKYYGKYRGTVFNNNDLEFKGRIQAIVPDVLGAVPTTWAMPCVPITGIAGLQSGIYVVPALDASVWIEFEHGDQDYPIWSGCFWGSQEEIPLVALAGDPVTPAIVLQSVGQNTVWIGGDPVTGITLSCGPADSPTSPRIMISAAGILISDGMGGSINIAAGVVTVNLGALIVK
jgi:hypothetical protein